MIKQKTYRAVVISLIVFIVCGYTFFFSSNFIFPTPKGSAYTQLNTKITINSTTSYTIYEWNYSTQQNKMEVILEFTTNDYSIVSGYTFQTLAKLRNSQQDLTTEVVYTDDNLYIIHINAVPNNFVEVSFRLIDIDGNMFKNYTNNIDVVKVNNIQVEDKESYRIRLINNQITSLSLEIEALQDSVKNNIQTIDNLRQSIIKIKENQRYEIEEEIEKSNAQISAYQKEIENLQKDNTETKKEIEQLQQKINAYQVKLFDIQNGTLEIKNAIQSILNRFNFLKNRNSVPIL